MQSKLTSQYCVRGIDTTSWISELYCQPRYNRKRSHDGESKEEEEEEEIFFGNYDSDWLCMPRGFGIEKFGLLTNSNETYSGREINIEFRGELCKTYPPQETACQATLNQLYLKGMATLILPCGFGKTICAIYICSQLKRRTIVIVNTRQQAEQWSQRLKSFTNSNQIIIEICNGKPVSDTSDIIILLIHSLYDKTLEHWNIATSSIGLAVIDEAHHIAAKSFSLTMKQLPCKYILGLTATPNRSDGLGRVVYWLVGQPSYIGKRDQCAPIICRRICWDMSHIPSWWDMRWNTMSLSDNYKDMYLSRILECVEYNEFMAESIHQLWLQNPLRYFLILSQRRSQLPLIGSILSKKLFKSGVLVCNQRGKLSCRKKKSKKKMSLILLIRDSNIDLKHNLITDSKLDSITDIKLYKSLTVQFTHMTHTLEESKIYCLWNSSKLCLQNSCDLYIFENEKWKYIADIISLELDNQSRWSNAEILHGDFGLVKTDKSLHFNISLTLARLFPTRVSDLISKFLYIKCHIGYVAGSMETDKWQPQLESNILLSTVQYCGEAFDDPKRDTLIMISPPRGSNEQIQGRILRAYPNKQMPLQLIYYYPQFCHPIWFPKWNAWKSSSMKMNAILLS